MQPRHEEEQETPYIVHHLGSPLGDDEQPVVPLSGGVPGDEAADAAGHDREEGGEEPAQRAGERPTQEQPRRGVYRLGDVLRRQLDAREDVLQNPGHGEEADEGREQILIGDRHRHQAAVEQDEPQEP